MKEVAPLFQRFFAATSFAEATVVKKNAKFAKELGLRARCRIVCPLSFVVRPFMPSTFSTALFLAWRTGDTGEQLLFSPASPALPAKFILLLPRDMCGGLVKDNKMTNCGSMMAHKMT